jgi:hypothetical protein
LSAPEIASLKRRKGEPMKKALILVCIATLVMTAGAALGCGGGDGGSGMSPKEVADAYMRASLDLDVDAAYELMSEADKKNVSKEQMAEMADASIMEGIDFSYTIGEETISGDTATVEVTINVKDKASGESEEMTDKLDLVKENGEWKIYFGDSL